MQLLEYYRIACFLAEIPTLRPLLFSTRSLAHMSMTGTHVWRKMPLPLDTWVPSRFTHEQGEAKYREHMAHMEDYLGPLHQFFYQYYGPELNAKQVASLCLLWQIASTCEEALFLAKWMQPFSDMSSLNLHHLLSTILPPQALPEYLTAEGTLNLLQLELLQLLFQTPMETWTFHEDQGTGAYEPLRDGDPLIYTASFLDNTLNPVPVQTPLHYDGAWKNLNFFVHRELDILVFTHEMEEEYEDGDLPEEDEPSTRSRTVSTQQASAMDSNIMLGEQEQPDDLDRGPMTDFQRE